MGDLARNQDQLKTLIEDSYNLNELQNLAFRLNIKYEELSGDTVSTKTIALIEYVCRHGLAERFKAQLLEDRTFLKDDPDWESIDWSKICARAPIKKNESKFDFNLGCAWKSFSVAINVMAAFLLLFIASLTPQAPITPSELTSQASIATEAVVSDEPTKTPSTTLTPSLTPTPSSTGPEVVTVPVHPYIYPTLIFLLVFNLLNIFLWIYRRSRSSKIVP